MMAKRQTPGMCQMDSVAMLGNTNWKLNMKRRELIKPELNPPYTRLCKEDITLPTKLFGDDLAKHLKDMSEAKKAGQQMQKPYPNSSNRGAVHSQKRNFSRFKPYHYDRTRGSGNKSTNHQPFLGQGRPSAPFWKKHPASINNKNQYHPVVRRQENMTVFITLAWRNIAGWLIILEQAS